MIVVLTGAPGAGKGTQADLLVDRFGFRKVSTGDALRRHIARKTEVGRKAEQIIAAGHLVPDEVLLEILREELGSDVSEKILLDGYPRNISQAETLSTLSKAHPVAGAIHLDVDRERLLARLSGRRVCSSCGKSFHVTLNPPRNAGVCDACGGKLTQRVDDMPEKVAVRLRVYENETAPILDYYKKNSLYSRVNGEGEQNQVYEEIEQVLERILPQ